MSAEAYYGGPPPQQQGAPVQGYAPQPVCFSSLSSMFLSPLVLFWLLRIATTDVLPPSGSCTTGSSTTHKEWGRWEGERPNSWLVSFPLILPYLFDFSWLEYKLKPKQARRPVLLLCLWRLLWLPRVLMLDVTRNGDLGRISRSGDLNRQLRLAWALIRERETSGLGGCFNSHSCVHNIFFSPYLCSVHHWTG